jgi:amino acid transporter
VAIVATLNGVLIQTIMASRVLYGLADRGHLPLVFSKVFSRTQTPVIATLTVVAIIAILALSLPITTLAEHTSQIVLGIFVLVNFALIRIKMTANSDQVYFRVPMVVPILGVITSVLLFGTSFL